MSLGAFSISLAVADLQASLAFYSRLGFSPVGGDGVRWQIVRSGTTTIGLFQGMFPDNILTFNPGWDATGSPTAEDFTDVRDWEARLRDAGLEILQSTTAQSPSGPASFVVVDPDGNPVLIDQHR